MSIIKSLIDTDLYKFSMMYVAFKKYPTKDVAYRFVCRNKEVNLLPYKEEIKQEISELCNLTFKSEEIDFLKKQNLYSEDFLSFLSSFKLNENLISITEKNGSLSIEAEGNWVDTILFEVFVLSIVNEVYFRNTQPNASREVGLKKLQEKIDLVKELNDYSNKKGYPLFKFIDFGTRRRFSSVWQGEIDVILAKELPENFVGTSSVYWAMKTGIKPVGTMAHEYLQFFQAVAKDLKHFQKEALEAWYEVFGGKLAVALSDVISTKAFLEDLTLELTNSYSGLRQDSGNPLLWADQVLAHYKKMGVDPKTKSLVFSDGLDFPKAKLIYLYTVETTNPLFGIGTGLTNSFNFKPLNIVMKMVKADGKPVAKISDEPNKAICDSPEFLDFLKDMFNYE